MCSISNDSFIMSLWFLISSFKSSPTRHDVGFVNEGPVQSRGRDAPDGRLMALRVFMVSVEPSALLSDFLSKYDHFWIQINQMVMNQSDVVNISAGLIEQCVRDNVCMCEYVRYGSSLDTVVGHSSLIKTSSLWISEMKAGYLRDSTAAGSVDSQPRSMEKFFNF